MALNQLGWIGWQPRGEVITFKEMFPGYSPNQVQINVIQLAKDIQSPYLVILEAQTGSGKTEAALYLSDISLQTDEKKGIYFALPTQATSNQMFQRVSKFLARRYPDRDINLHLVHGKALYNPKASAFSISNIWSEIGEKEGNLHSYSWFLPRKRTLLAPFGVGTVDQTFISVLRSRHFFVRLFGLSHKVLVFDEVHAYDVYMTEVFKNLLHWLRSIGTSVIILSATLTKSERKELLDAYTGKDNQLDDIPYPRITASFNNQIKECKPARQLPELLGFLG
jgi:CRISPR-associated endonuclease/helicase Cas3